MISELRPNHTSAEFIKFLNKINREVPDHLDVHVVLDNLSTHKTPAVHKWLLRHRRFHFHFTPTYGSWMNLVQRWFSALTTKKLQRSAHTTPSTRSPPTLSTGSNTGTRTRPRSSGTAPQMKSSNDSTATASPSSKTTSSTDQPDRTLREPAGQPADGITHHMFDDGSLELHPVFGIRPGAAAAV